MSRNLRIPSYRLHKASGQAVVVLNGISHYLGKFRSPASQAEYERVIAEWLASHRLPPVSSVPPSPAAGAPSPNSPLTIADLLSRYWRFVQNYYVKDGSPTSEQDTIRQALRFVRRLYGPMPVSAFGPLALKAVRQAMIDHPITRKHKVKNPHTGETHWEEKVMHIGLSRRHINKQIGRLKRMFGWAVENELVAADIYQALAPVKGLRKDKTAAREKASVKPVSDEHVAAILPLVPPTIRTMILVQRLCGGRPQDIVVMRPCDIDTSNPVWVYQPKRHKGEHRERDRVVFLGPRAQALLKAHLTGIGSEQYVFSPFRAEAARLAGIRQRKGEPTVKVERDRGKWAIRDYYDAASYRRAVRRACKKAKIPVWCPLQLRHSAATAIRQRYGLEASQAVLGHAELGVTQVYAEVDLDRARRVMAEVG
jgi:integrase